LCFSLKICDKDNAIAQISKKKAFLTNSLFFKQLVKKGFEKSDEYPYFHVKPMFTDFRPIS